MTIAEWEERKNRNKLAITVGDRVRLVYAGPSPTTGDSPSWAKSNLNKVFTVLNILSHEIVFLEGINGSANIARFDVAVRNNPKEKSLVYFNP